MSDGWARGHFRAKTTARVTLTAAAAVLLLLGVVACGGDNDAADDAATEADSDANAGADEAAFPVTIEHALGETELVDLLDADVLILREGGKGRGPRSRPIRCSSPSPSSRTIT
jgi:hypothetical protein